MLAFPCNQVLGPALCMCLLHGNCGGRPCIAKPVACLSVLQPCRSGRHTYAAPLRTPCPTPALRRMQFGQQEPGSNAEIASFAKSQHGASFPLFAKVDVNGASAAPLFTWLKANTHGGQ